jgi:hypothetical protein
MNEKMSNDFDENSVTLALVVVSISTLLLGFVAGFGLASIERHLVIKEIHILLDRAIEKKFERDEYVARLEAMILDLQASHIGMKRKREEEECISGGEADIEALPPPTNPIERCVATGVPDSGFKED